MTKLQGKAAYIAGTKGQPLEHDVEVACDRYRTEGRVSIIKIPTPHKVVRRTGAMTQIVYNKPSTVDFEGFVMSGRLRGRHVAIEAKTALEEYGLPFENVEAHQAEYLRSVHEAHGIAGLIVRLGKEKKNYWIPAHSFLYWWDRQDGPGGRKSYPVGEMIYEIPWAEDGTLDFLRTIGEWWKDIPNYCRFPDTWPKIHPGQWTHIA